MRVAQGPLLIHVKPANAAAATAIYEGVTASLRTWTLWFVAIPAVVLVFTLLWGRLGIIPGIGRGYRAAVEQVRSRRAAHELAQAAAVDGTDPRPAESWTHRVAADTRTFIDGVGMSSWLDRLGGFVRRHLPAVRWAGVAAGALVLLFWPAPTLTVLIWVVALIALYLGLLEWLQSRAADPVTVPGPAAAVPPASGAPANGAAASRIPAPPPARPATRENLSAMGSRLDLLMRLGEARTAGVLTDDEFAQEKTHLLAPTGTASVTSPVHSRHPVSARRCPGRRQAMRLRLRVRRAHPARRKPNPAHLDGPPKPCWVSPICPTSDSVTANRWRHEFTGRLDRRLNRRSAHVQRDSANRTRSAGGGMRGSGTSALVVRRQGCAGGCGPCRAEARRVGAAAKISAR